MGDAFLSRSPVNYRAAKARLSFPLLTLSLIAALPLPEGLAAERNRLGPSLQQIVLEHERNGLKAAERLAGARGMKLRGGGAAVLVPVILEPQPGKTASSIDVAAVQALGGKVDAVSQSFMRVLVPFNRIRDLAKHPHVRRVRAPIPHKAHYGPNISESVNLTGAGHLHASDTKGSGIKVAVVDLGFIGLSAAMNLGELPANTVAVKGNQEGLDIEQDTEHGVGVAEHVMDMAPGATLYCIKVDDEVDLENAADYIANNGIRVANHSVGWVNYSYYDDTGTINTIINDSHDNDGVFWTISAGNDAQRHWRGTWADSDTDNYHDFAAGDEIMRLTTSSSIVQVFLNWDQYGNCTTDLDLIVVDKLNFIVATSVTRQTSSDDPAEAVGFYYGAGAGGPYGIVVQKYSGDATGLDMTIFSFYNNLEAPVAASSLMDPADAHGGFSVGAIDFYDWDDADPPPESFSSQGPTNDGRLKPEIAAPDGTTCWAYGYESAFGTSFSSPTTAGAATLLLGDNPSQTPDDLKTALMDLAVDIGDTGDDNVFGAGKLFLASHGSQTTIGDVEMVVPSGTTNVPIYSKVELLVTLTDVDAAMFHNPDPSSGGIDLSAAFTGPSGTWSINGFYDGQDWRVRFAPDSEGSWTYSVSVQDASGTANWSGGSFNCVASGYPGWLRLDGQYLEYPDGTPFFGVGHNTGWQPQVEQPTFAEMASRGENLLSFWLAAPWATVSSSTEGHRVPMECIEGGLGYYSRAACDYIDGLVEDAETEGVCLLPTIWSHGQLRDENHAWSDNPPGNHWWYNNAYSTICTPREFFATSSSGGDTPQWTCQKNLFRYMIARWGYSRAIAGWVALCEVDGTTGWAGDRPRYRDPDAVSVWCAAVHNYFAANDPFRNSASGYPITTTMVDNPNWTGDYKGNFPAGFDLLSTDSYQSQNDDIGVASTIAGQTITMLGHGKPCFHGEFGGYVGGGATQPTHLHNGIWAGAAAGATITPLVWCDDGGWPMLTSDMQNHLQYLSDFMAGIDYLDRTDIASSSLTVSASVTNPGACVGWVTNAADRGFLWIQNTAVGGHIGGQQFTLTGLDAGDYGIMWYDAWTSGQDAFTVTGPLTANSDVVVTVPDLAQADIAAKFMPYSELPTYVMMGPLSARDAGVGTLIEWTTLSEVDNLGFHVLRRRPGGGGWQRVTAHLVPGRLTASGPHGYEYLDVVRPGRYEYCIESVADDGGRERHGLRKDMTVHVSGRACDTQLNNELGPLLRERVKEAISSRRAEFGSLLRRGQLMSQRRVAKTVGSSRNHPPSLRILSSGADLPDGDEQNRPRQQPGPPLPGDLRIRTKGDGIFHVPAGLLERPSQNIALIREGIRHNPLRADFSGIWFFAPAYEDEYTDLNATFVTSLRGRPRGTAVSRPPAGLFSSGAWTVASSAARAEEDAMFVAAAEGAPDAWFYNALLLNGQPEKSVGVHVAGFAGGAATLRVAVFGYTYDNAVAPDHRLIVSLNGRAIADPAWDGRDYRVFEIPLDADAIHEGPNIVGLLLPDDPGIPNGHGLVLDFIEIEYTRYLSVSSGPLFLQVERPGIVEAAGFASPSAWIVSVSRQGQDVLQNAAFLEKEPGRYAARFHARRGFYYIARPDDVRSPDEMKRAAICSVPPGADYLAVGPEAFRNALAPLLEARRGQGLRPAYVPIEKAIDTFGYGRYGSAAISGLVQQCRPRYLLLVGDNTYDYLNREGKGVDPMVPAVLVPTRYLCRANADALYGDTNGDGVPEIPVGRLPVRNPEQLERLVAKVVDHDVLLSELYGVLVADNTDQGGDFAAAQEALARNHPEVDWAKLYIGIHGDNAEIRQCLTQSVNEGADLVVYQGHGSSSRLAHGLPILDLAEAAKWEGSAVVYLSTCWGAYVQQNTNAAASIAEVLLRSRGGAPALIGSTTLSTQKSQAVLLGEFLDEALADGVGIGDALVRAQRRTLGKAGRKGGIVDQDVLDTIRCYVVLGDPAMPLAPSHTGRNQGEDPEALPAVESEPETAF